MNLINLKFIKENIKKSKGIIILLLCVIPFINAIFLYNNYIHYGDTLINYSTLEKVTFYSSFIFSGILSYILNKYLFKQKEVDFYLSKPISRKKIYLSNLLEFIALTIILLLLNTLSLIIITLITEISIPIMLYIDYFIYNFILYIFIYSIITLAMVISPNVIVSIIISIIIMFSYPFMFYINKTLTEENTRLYTKVEECNDTYFDCVKTNDGYKYYLDYYKNYNTSLSLPISFIIREIPLTKDIVKTSILAIMYLSLGYIIFKKRNYDGDTYIKNNIIHYILKTIVLIPFTFIFTYYFKEMEALTIILLTLGIIALYVVYDILTKRPYKLSRSLIMFVWTFVPIMLISSIFIKGYDKEKEYKLDSLKYDDTLIENVNIELENNNDINYYEFSNTKYNFSLPINEDEWNRIYEKTKNKNLEHINNFGFNDFDYLLIRGEKVDKSLLVTNNLKMNKEDLLLNDKSYKGYIEVTKYHNFKYDSVHVPFDINDKTLENINNYLRQDFLNNTKKGNIIHASITGYDEAKRNEIENILNNNTEALENYLIEHANDKISKDYKILFYYTSENNGSKHYIINDVDSFNNFINSLKETDK